MELAAFKIWSSFYIEFHIQIIIFNGIFRIFQISNSNYVINRSTLIQSIIQFVRKLSIEKKVYCVSQSKHHYIRSSISGQHIQWTFKHRRSFIMLHGNGPIFIWFDSSSFFSLSLSSFGRKNELNKREPFDFVVLLSFHRHVCSKLSSDCKNDYYYDHWKLQV